MMNALLVVFSSLLMPLILFSAELALRHLYPDYLDQISADHMNYLHRYSETYGWELKDRFRPGWIGQEIELNQKGYVGRIYDNERDYSKTRILMLGDSIAFGFGVKPEETFSSILDVSEEQIEVVNLAVQGYGTDQELIRFQKEGLNYKPDIAILNFCLGNDFMDNAASKSIYGQAYPKPYFILENGELKLCKAHLELSLIRRISFQLSQKSILFNKVLTLFGIDGRKLSRNLIKVEERSVPSPELTCQLIKRMDEIAKENDICFVVLVYPYKDCFSGDCELAKALFGSPILSGVRMINLYSYFKRYNFNLETFDRYSFDSTLHLTPLGHRLTARIVREILFAEEICRSDPTPDLVK